MKFNLPDFDVFFFDILEAGKHADMVVSADVNHDSYDCVPVLIYQVSNNGQTGHGLWDCVLHVTLVCDGDPHPMLSHVYTQIANWNNPGMGVVDDLGVLSVEDVTVFRRVFDDVYVNGKHLSQHSASFRIVVRDYS